MTLSQLQHHIPFLVQDWYEQIAPTDISPFDTQTVRARLTDILVNMLRLIDESPPNRPAMQKLGKRLVQMRYNTPESISVTLETLSQRISPLLREDQVPQLRICLSEMTAGFFREFRSAFMKDDAPPPSNIIDKLVSLYNATSMLSVTHDMDETAQLISRLVVDEFNQIDCAILLIEPNHKELRRITRSGSLNIQTPHPLFLDGPGLVLRAIRSKMPVYAPDVSRETDYVANDPRTVSEFVVPLISGGQVIGAIDLQSVHHDGFSERDRLLIRLFADRAVDALVNAQLRDAINQQQRTLEERVSQRTAELMKTKEQVESILNSSSDAIFLAYAEQIVRQSNPAFNIMFGYDPDEIFGLEIAHLLMPESREIFAGAFEDVVRTMHNFRVEVEMRRKDGQPFNADVMLSAIVEPGAGQAHIIICSVRDVSEQKWLEETLRQSLVKERELNDLRAHFSSMLSHEFRNPLAVIMSASELLQNYADRMPPQEQIRYLERIKGQVRQLTGLLDDILLVSKGRAVAALNFQPGSFELIGFCKQVIHEMPLEHHGRVKFYSDFSEKVIKADPKLLKLCLTNLLSNALKYSPLAQPVSLDLIKLEEGF